MDYDIKGLKRKLLSKYPFFSSATRDIDFKVNKQIPIAGTNGKTIYYNPDKLANFSEDEQLFILAHEVCHIAFDHIKRLNGRDPRIWNEATDAVINANLKKDGMKLIDGCIEVDEAINYDAEEFYEKLIKEKNKESKDNQKEEQEENKSNQDNNENSIDENDNSTGHASHEMWKDAINQNEKETEKEKDKKGNMLSKFFEKLKKDKQDNKHDSNEEKSEFDEKVEELSQMGENQAFKNNNSERIKELEELKKELLDYAKQADDKSNGQGINLGEIGRTKPLIDWRYILREAIKHDVDWSYDNCSIEDGVVTASLLDQPLPETEILLDTSGSINKNLLLNFLKECKNIMTQSNVKVGCFDTNFYGFNEIRTESDIEQMNFQGGGGTNFEVAMRAFSNRVENKIIFTDGDATMPNLKINIIWIVFGNKKIHPQYGRVIYIDNECLRKLYDDNIDYNNFSKRIR